MTDINLHKQIIFSALLTLCESMSGTESTSRIITHILSYVNGISAACFCESYDCSFKNYI